MLLYKIVQWPSIWPVACYLWDIYPMVQTLHILPKQETKARDIRGITSVQIHWRSPVQSFMCHMVKDVDHIIRSITPRFWGSSRHLQYKERAMIDIPNLPFCRVLLLTLWDYILVLDCKFAFSVWPLLSSLFPRIAYIQWCWSANFTNEVLKGCIQLCLAMHVPNEQ